ncbi:MAG: GatB/YqeY domain-containing protein [Halofilum sp. (in: g-proteobacteria)]|nr:GatB/YqeY domain-containing protein [Halofilum sp. (in: g-proteobacteria)]
MTGGSIKERLSADIKAAMKAGDKERLGRLRMIHAAIKQREVDERTELDDPATLEVLDRKAKQHRESIAQYRDAGRDDLADREEAELAVIAEYLPEPLDEAALDALIDEAIAATGASSMKEMGQVMGRLKPRVQGRADMGAVSARVKSRLG